MRENWKEVRLKDVTILNPSINEEFEELVSFIPMENLRNGFINYSDVIQFQEAKGKYTYFSNGDLLIAKVTPCFENGNIAIAKKLFNKKGFGSSEIFVLRTLKNISEYFLFYYCQSISFREKAISTMYGVAGLKRIPSLFMRTYSLHLPPITTQHAITNYLDEKLAVIDRYILLLEKKRDCYTVLRKSLINKIVRYGLNPDVELKDSGIEWLGKIPKHWEVKRMKDIGYIYSGLSGKSGEDFNNDETEYNRPFIPYTNILNNLYIDVNQTKGVVIYENENQNRVKKDDLFFLMSSEDYESLGLSSILIEEVSELYLNSFCKGFRFTCQNIYPKFVNFQLRSDLFRDAIRLEGRGFTRINLKIDKITSQFVSLPPLSEQQSIACYLDAQSEKIDRIVANINMQLGKLTKLKKSLINECVTGERIIQI